jgi:biopolymer transport protein ExbB/TolQ
VTLEISFVIGVVLAIVASALTFVWQYLQQQRRRAKAPTLEDRVKTLARDLEVASASVSEIEREISKRREIATKLKEDVKYYEELKALNEAQIEAITSTLRVEVDRSQRKSLYMNAIINVVVALTFFMLGLILGG